MTFKVIPRFVVLWMCFISLHLYAQQEGIISRAYTMRDGLPDDGVNCAMQDSRGFLWLGTFSGLSKFDGYSFVNYKNNPSSSNSLRNNYVRSILEDKYGRLWVSHIQGVDLFDPQTETFLLHWPDLNSMDSQAANKLRKKKDGKIWVCTDRGVYVANPETLEFVKVPKIPSCFTYDIVETDDGGIITASGNCGVIFLDAATGEVTQFRNTSEHTKSIVPSSDCFSIKIDENGEVWVGANNGIYHFDYGVKAFTFYPINQLTRIICIADSPDGKLWVGGRNGLFVFDPKSGQTDELAHIDHINSILKDKQGIFWAATFQGLQQLNSGNKRFTTFEGLGEIGTLAEAPNHDVWFVSSQGHGRNNLIFKLSSAGGNGFQSEPDLVEALGQSNLLRSLFSDRDGNIWLASLWKLEKCDIGNQTFNVTNLTQKIFAPPVTSYMDSHGSVWFGDWESANKFDIKTGDGEVVSPHISTVYSFVEDQFQNIWIGSTAGLTRYNLTNKNMDLFSNESNDPQSLSSNTVYHVSIDQENTIWVGTAGGLNKMIKGTENTKPRFQSWRSNYSGLPNDNVYSIVHDDDSTLWIACGNKISHFNPKQNIFKTYDRYDGLTGSNFRGVGYLPGKGLRSHHNYILFGSRDGLVVFHPDSINDNTYVPPIKITSFSIHNQVVPVKGTYADTMKWESPLAKTITYTDTIKLSYDQNDFNLEFAVLNYVNPERNQYKYKLEPYQTKWIETTASNRIAQYTNLNPGTYTFSVTGSNNDGLWNEKGATLIIIITPPWWQTWWAYTLYGVVLVGIFLYWRSFEIKRLKLKHRAEHLSELDNLKTRFFTNISHEFRTPITLIQGPLKELYNKASSKEDRSTFGIMLRNVQRLSKLINQLLDLSKLEAGKMALHATEVDLVQLLREIASSYESLAVNKNIKYFFYPEVNEIIAYIDTEKIENVVHNLLSNALKFTKEGGEVILYLKAARKHCTISVKDTGIGIPIDQLDRIFDRFYQVDSSQTREHEGSGLGMALAKELIELHRGTIAVESTDGRGTTFTVTLPLGKDHLNAGEIVDGVDPKKSETYINDLTRETERDGQKREKVIEPSDQPILLIVEDNEDMRHYIRKTFSDQYQIIEAANGKEGITKSQEVLPDLIISDVMMPEMDGYKFCERIKSNELTSHIPVILLTAKADHQSKLTGLETGADDYLVKPFDADEMKLIVKNRIEQRRRLRERFSREVTLEPKKIAITSFDEKFVNKVLAIVESHMDDERFTVEALSHQSGYSNMHFYRKIKALTDQTPSQFLRTVRLKRAADLLRRKSDNVTQIAYSVGFKSLSHFNKCFKEQFGVTPGQFAEKSTGSEA